MTNEISENFIYFKTTKEIWETAKTMYSNVDNTFAIFKIKRVLHYLRQEETSVTEYFNTFNRYWQQLDVFE